MKRENIPGGYKHLPRAVKAGNLIFMAAAGIDHDGNVVGPSFEEQLDYIYKEIKETLESVGSSMENIVQMTMYHVDARNMGKGGPIRRKYIPDDKIPMTAGIGIKELMPIDPPLLIETTLTAIIPDE